MTNGEFIKNLSIDELADYYCYLHGDDCEHCIHEDKCHETNNKSGIANWLREEHIVSKEGW